VAKRNELSFGTGSLGYRTLNGDGGQETTQQTRPRAGGAGPSTATENSSSSVKCPHCEQGFGTVRGLGVHITSKHREKRDEALTGARASQSRARWLAEERLAMAKQEAQCQLRGDDLATINGMCNDIFPDRTLESIKCQRKRADYKALVESELIRLKETSRQPEVEDIGPEDDEELDQGVGIRFRSARVSR
jgi:hypothetical protein